LNFKIVTYYPSRLSFQRVKESLAESPTIYRLAKGSFWLFLSILASRAFSLVSSIVVARILGKESYGTLGMYQSTIDMMGVIAGFGLGTSLTKYISQFKYKNPEKAGRVLTLISIVAIISSSLAAVIFFAISPWLVTSLLNRPNIADLFRVGSVSLIISTIFGVEIGSLAGFEAFRKTTRISLWQGLTISFLTILGVLYWGIWGVVIAGIIGGIVGIILSTHFLIQECRAKGIAWKWEKKIWFEWPILWKFAFPMMTASLLLSPVIWITNKILINQPDGYSELGRFNAANQWRMLFLFLQGTLATTMLPILSEIHGGEDRSRFVSTITLNTRATWTIALPIATLIIALSHPLAKIYGGQFKGIEPVITVLAFSSFLNLINSTVGVALVSSEKIWLGTLMNFGWALVVVIMSWMLIPNYGAIGMALAYLIAYCAHTLWQMTYVECFLAPCSLSGQWFLFSSSLIILSIISLLNIFGENSYVPQIIIVLISFCPLVKASSNQIRKSLID
jgi:O-antigen/teichoic acid export membrane protein